jgi:hypothetical protein
LIEIGERCPLTLLSRVLRGPRGSAQQKKGQNSQCFEQKTESHCPHSVASQLPPTCHWPLKSYKNCLHRGLQIARESTGADANVNRWRRVVAVAGALWRPLRGTGASRHLWSARLWAKRASRKSATVQGQFAIALEARFRWFLPAWDRELRIGAFELRRPLGKLERF